jgi:predicted nuclease of predicted toxin-antitoxin system
LIGILLDQGLPRTTGKILRKKGWSAVHTGDIGLSAATDHEILEYARTEKRVVITLDADFHSILAVANESAPSVVRIRQEGLKGPAMAALIEDIWPLIFESVKSGALISVTERSIRIKRIPLLNTDD